MFKKVFYAAVALLASFSGRAQGLWAELGEQDILPGFRSNSNYSTLGATKHIFVQGTAAYRAHQATAATSGNLLGVMQNNPGIDEAMSIACAGLSKVVAGGALTANAIITTNASGRAAVVGSGEMAAGRVLEAAGADGDVVTAMLFHPVRWAGA